MRKPRDPERYTTPEKAAKFLEQMAKDLREHTPDKTLVKLSLTTSFWQE